MSGINGYGVEVLIREEDFLKVKETLTRIGVLSKKDNTLTQSINVLHKQGKYYLIHFKELFALDGKGHEITENDIARRNTVANLLEEWELVEVVNPEETDYPTVPVNQLKIVGYNDKHKYKLVAKYNIGKVKLK